MNITLQHRGAPRTARRVVAEYCRDARAGNECRDTAVLLTSELVTNALLHGRGPVRLRLKADAHRLRVEVGDDDPGHPRAPTQMEGAESGRGMLIVSGLAAAWGVVDHAAGKTVWFELGVQP